MSVEKGLLTIPEGLKLGGTDKKKSVVIDTPNI